MPAQVTLTIVNGSMEGKKIVFNDRTLCTIGRAKSCLLQLPDEGNRAVSRHHCVLDIKPPTVQVHNLGSLNGTYINGENIGQRDWNQPAEEAVLADLPAYDLLDGDEIQVGNTIFRINICLPATCLLCAKPIPEEQWKSAEWSRNIFVCQGCRHTVDQAQRPTRDRSPGENSGTIGPCLTTGS